MPPIVLFAILLAIGIAILPLSKSSHGISKTILVLISVLMIALSAFGIFTALLP